MGSIWGWQDPDGPQVGPMSFTIWAIYVHRCQLFLTFLFKGFQLNAHLTPALTDTREFPYSGEFEGLGAFVLKPTFHETDLEDHICDQYCGCWCPGC